MTVEVLEVMVVAVVLAGSDRTGSSGRGDDG